MQYEMIPTLNRMGYSFENLTTYGDAFLDFCAITDGPVLDIGAAYGVATIRALEKGAFVIANDIDAGHLKAIKEKANSKKLPFLKTIKAPFPHLTLEENSLGGILMSQVLHFLPHEELDLAAAKMFSLLKPGGKAFLTAATPYVSMFSRFTPIFESRKRKGNKYPGLIEELSLYVGTRAKEMPLQMNLFDTYLLEKLMRSVGFKVERCEYIARPDFPPEMRLDGRENVGIIVKK